MSDEALTIEQQIAEQNKTIAALLNSQQQTNAILQQLAASSNRPEPEKPRAQLELTDEEIAAPTARTIAKIVAHSNASLKDEILKSVKPLEDQTKAFAARSEYERLKSQMKATPDYADVVEFESIFDGIMSNQAINPDAMIAAYHIAHSRWIKTGGKSKVKTDNEGQGDDNKQTPAHLSAPRPKTTGGGPKSLRALNDNEATLARQRGWSQARYLYEADEITYDDYIAIEKRANPNFDVTKVRRHD